jgi:hypothetical protein
MSFFAHFKARPAFFSNDQRDGSISLDEYLSQNLFP